MSLFWDISKTQRCYLSWLRNPRFPRTSPTAPRILSTSTSPVNSRSRDPINGWPTQTSTTMTLSNLMWNTAVSELCSGKNYLNDGIIDYFAKNLGTLFCGDVSKFSTFIFPHNFSTRLMNISHNRIEGVLDVKKGIKVAVNLSPQKNLMDYDHLIIYNNPFKRHWNLVAVFPRRSR